MPVSAELLKALAEDPKSLEQQLGCMTGLFQIFDRQGLGRRYGSKRVSNAGSGQSQPTSACETPRHDHRGSNPYWMFEDDASQRISSDSFMGGKHGVVESATREHHHREYSDSSEIFTKSFETPTESRTSPDEKSQSQQLDHSPMCSEESVGGLAFYYNDIPAAANSSASSSYPTFDHSELRNAQQHCPEAKLKVVVPTRTNSTATDAAHPTTSSSDIRDIVRASFDRDPQQRSRNAELTASKPRLSVDGSHSSNQYHGYVKNLPRSSSVDGRDNRLRLSMDQSASPTPRPPPADLPRSSSVGGRGAARILADWKDGLRSSGGSPRLTNKEKEILKQNSDLIRNSVDSRKVQNSGDGRDATRLTVELKEGPRLSVDRRAVVASPRLGSRPCEPLLPTDFKESLRAADIKEFLRGSQKLPRDGHRFSVDGTRDAPRASTAPRLSVDGREYNPTTGLVPRRLKLDRVGLSNDSTAPREFIMRQSSGRGNVECEEMRRKAPNVVARLMGLEELPSSKHQPSGGRRGSTDPLQEFLHLGGSISPPPPPSPPDDYDYAHRSSDQDVLRHWQKRVGAGRPNSEEEEESHFLPSTRPRSLPPSSSSRGVSPDQGGVMNATNQSADSEDRQSPVDQPQGQRKSPQGRRSLWHIFEAMQLKGLLNGSSSKKKQAEALRLHNLKMTEEKAEMENKKRSQSLPPRLSKDRSGVEYQHTPDRVLNLPLNRESIFPKASVPEARHNPGSALDRYRQATVKSEAESRSMVNHAPNIITRSMDTMEAAPSPPPDVEDALSKNISRGVSKSDHRADVNEPLQAADSLYSHNTSSSASGVGQLQSRTLERGAGRMKKSSFSNHIERDTSPRGPRAYTNSVQQEKPPPRSCSPRGDSHSVSPRSVDGIRLMEASKVRRKQAIAVKDREELTKASLANLRANATKQEFLKGRASGDPDTPRLLRRSSSESKLLSKISEKPITDSTPKPSSGAGRTATPNITLPTRTSKTRPVSSKDNKLSPLKTRTTNPKTVAKPSPPKETVAAEHVNKPKPVPNCASVSQRETPTQEQQTRNCSKVRATEGGASEHSDDTTHSNTKLEQRTESKARDKTLEIDEGVKTPRGVSIKKIVFSEDAQAEVAEQPSPVSVLDNSHFEEELTPSPKAGCKSTVIVQEQQSRNEKDRRWNSARFLDLDIEDGTKEETSSVVDIRFEDSTHRRVCLKDADEERRYVEELVEASSLGSGGSFPDLWSSSDYVMDPSVFDQLETKRSDDEEILDRRLLFDCVNEVLERLVENQVRGWTGLRLRKRRPPMGKQLVKEVLVEIVDIPCAADSEDVCDTVYVILQKDLVRGRQWPDYNKELEDVGMTVEKMIVKDLVEETVRELSANWLGDNGPRLGASRRQLFA